MICPSCQKRKIESVKDHENNGFQYSLCLKCEERLINYALRPIEYFRLKAFYGDTHLLHDDFYDEDGTACQANQSLGFFKGKSFPKLKELKTLKDLIDLATVVWEIDKPLKESINKYTNEEIEEELIKRLEERPYLKQDIIRITSKVINGTSSTFVKSLWTNRNNEEALIEYAELLANSFKGNEGVLDYLSQLDKIESGKELNEQVGGLIFFKSPKIISWIENSAARIKNITDVWGTVSALSDIDWDTIIKWMDNGRPLSLVAIDALSEYATDQHTLNRSPLSRYRIKGLPQPPENKVIIDSINNYLQIDGVTRVKQRVQYIESNINKITRRKSG
jgi:hypothetical protein